MKIFNINAACFVALSALMGCQYQPVDEIDTFSQGDSMYIKSLMTRINEDPLNEDKELRDKLELALRDARNRKQKRLDKEDREAARRRHEMEMCQMRIAEKRKH